jgi:hypothetical protein
VSPARESRAWQLLALGAFAGTCLGGVSAWRGTAMDSEALPAELIARVNGRPVLREEFERAFSLVAGDRREPPNATDRARVLERLIDEELLVQHALASGLLGPDAGIDGRAVRDVVVRTMVETATAEAASREPSADDLRALLDKAGNGAGDAMPSLEALRTQLDAALVARARDEALAAYTDELRARARITVEAEDAR